MRKRPAERAKELGIRLQAFAQGNSPAREPISLPAIIDPVAGALFKGSNILATITMADDSLFVEADLRQIDLPCHPETAQWPHFRRIQSGNWYRCYRLSAGSANRNKAG